MGLKKLVVFGALFFSSLVAADYTQGVSSLYDASGKVVGRLLPSVEVEILGKSGDRTKVAFSGYIQKGNEGAIYYAVNRRILVAGLSKNAKLDFETLDSVMDEGKEWLKVKVALETDEKGFTSDIAGLYKKAETMYADNCSICHKLHGKKEFSANQWPSVINSMLSRTAISKDDSYLLIQYLQKNAKDMP